MNDDGTDFELVLSWWFLLPLVICIVLFASFVRRRAALGILSVFSIIIAIVTAIMIPVSWNNLFQANYAITLPEKTGSMPRVPHFHVSSLRFSANHGGYQLNFGVLDESGPQLGPWEDNPMVILLHGHNKGRYPVEADKFSLTKSGDFVQRILGFQVCWWSVPPVKGQTENIRVDSITVPHWFVLLLCLPFPLIWLRRFRHHRYRLRHNLCLTCGYDLRAATEKCPECGTPIPYPKLSLENPQPTATPQ